MKRFQAQYSISQGSGFFKKDPKTKRLVFVRTLGTLVKHALKFGVKRIGEKIPMSELVTHIQSKSKGANARDVHYIVAEWLVNEFDAVSVKDGILTFKKNAKSVLDNFTAK